LIAVVAASDEISLRAKRVTASQALAQKQPTLTTTKQDNNQYF
jgi:hypothetical protein